jgi:hypothetical protein
MQEISRALSMCCRAEYRALVIFENLQPALDIGRMILACLRGQGQISAKECRA